MMCFTKYMKLTQGSTHKPAVEALEVYSQEGIKRDASRQYENV